MFAFSFYSNKTLTIPTQCRAKIHTIKTKERGGHMNVLIALTAIAAVVLTGKYTYQDFF